MDAPGFTRRGVGRGSPGLRIVAHPPMIWPAKGPEVFTERETEPLLGVTVLSDGVEGSSVSTLRNLLCFAHAVVMPVSVASSITF